jgi:hypothetical protein
MWICAIGHLRRRRTLRSYWIDDGFTVMQQIAVLSTMMEAPGQQPNIVCGLGFHPAYWAQPLLEKKIPVVDLTFPAQWGTPLKEGYTDCM